MWNCCECCNDQKFLFIKSVQGPIFVNSRVIIKNPNYVTLNFNTSYWQVFKCLILIEWTYLCFWDGKGYPAEGVCGIQNLPILHEYRYYIQLTGIKEHQGNIILETLTWGVPFLELIGTYGSWKWFVVCMFLIEIIIYGTEKNVYRIKLRI